MKAYTVYTYIERVYIILLCSIAGTACGGQLSVNNINNIARTVTDLLHPTIYTENSSNFERKLRKCFLICTWKRFGYLFKYCTTPKSRVGNSIIGFSIESLVFGDRKINGIDSSPSIGERISKINDSDSLTVEFFKRLTRGIRSRSIFLKDRRERFDQGRLIEISRRAIRSQSIFFKDRKIEDRKIEFPSQPKS